MNQMHTTCVPVVLDLCHMPPYIAQAMGARATLTTHRMHLLLTADQNTWLEGQATGLRNKSAVVRDLIDTARQGVDTGATLPAYRVGAGDQGLRVPAVQVVPEPPPACEMAVKAVEDSAETKKKSKENKRHFLKEIRDSIQQHSELIEEFWKGKGGSKSQTAWKLLMTELEKLQKDHGDAVVSEQLQLAINGKWKGISAARYEQFKAPKGATPAQASEPNREYGTGRVFTADDFYGTTADDNPLQELF